MVGEKCTESLEFGKNQESGTRRRTFASALEQQIIRRIIHRAKNCAPCLENHAFPEASSCRPLNFLTISSYNYNIRMQQPSPVVDTARPVLKPATIKVAAMAAAWLLSRRRQIARWLTLSDGFASHLKAFTATR
jgi:hypothetical protein